MQGILNARVKHLHILKCVCIFRVYVIKYDNVRGGGLDLDFTSLESRRLGTLDFDRARGHGVCDVCSQGTLHLVPYKPVPSEKKGKGTVFK